jgi:hypothetical protein
MWLQLDVKIGALVLMSLALALLCGCIEWQRHKLRRRLNAMKEMERNELASADPEIRFSRSPFQGKSYLITMLVGQLSVNVVLLPAFIAPLWLVQRWLDPNEHPLANFLAIVLGFFVAWGWWSIGVSVWRWWAIHYRDMSAEEVQWRGESASLLWPEDHWCTRTALYAWFAAKRRWDRQGHPPT